MCIVNPAIQTPQIRQILLAFKEVLGANPEYTKIQKTSSFEETYISAYNFGFQYGITPDSQAEALCSRWLDGLEPMIEREPETVLSELLDILKKI
jgi:hypothetical protein